MAGFSTSSLVLSLVNLKKENQQSFLSQQMSEIVSYGSGVRNRSLKICFCIFFHLGK
jgi:hypothetical protein